MISMPATPLPTTTILNVSLAEFASARAIASLSRRRNVCIGLIKTTESPSIETSLTVAVDPMPIDIASNTTGGRFANSTSLVA